MQKTHESTIFEKKKFPVVLVLDNISSPANIGSLFRLVDAFGIEKMIICGTIVDLKSNRLRRTARATEKDVVFEEHEETLEVCEGLKEKSYQILALEIATGSKSLQEIDFTTSGKIALVIGNERDGIKNSVLRMADGLLHINMFGKNSSMNVTHATAIALFEITKSLQPVR